MTRRRLQRNVLVDVTLVNAVKRALGVATQAEAIEAAFDAVLFREELVDGVDALVRVPIARFDE